MQTGRFAPSNYVPHWNSTFAARIIERDPSPKHSRTASEYFPDRLDPGITDSGLRGRARLRATQVRRGHDRERVC